MAGIMIISLIIVLFFISGWYLGKGKGSFLIAGYNTMSEEEKAQYDTVALCKFVGRMMYQLGLSMIFWILAIYFKDDRYFILGLIVFLIIVFSSVIYLNTGNRFKIKEGRDEHDDG